MNRDRERFAGHRPFDENRQRDEHRHDAQRSSNFQDSHGQRWESAGGHRASNRDWHRDREDGDFGPGYGVGAESAYGVPADERYFARRYGTQMPQPQRDPWNDRSEWEFLEPAQRPGYTAPVSGQTSEGGFYSPDLDGPSHPPLTGDDLRRGAHRFDHDYVTWRNDQLDSHDRDYRAWRDEQQRAYDEDYSNWRRERQDKFGKDFTDWRSQRTASPASAPNDAQQQRTPLSASRPGEPDKPKKHDA